MNTITTPFDVSQLIEKGQISNEVELERATIADRKLRLLIKEHPHLKSIRKKLRSLIGEYENLHWSDDANISNEQIQESDLAEKTVEEERLFIKRRKELIRQKLKTLNLTQQDFGKILGHGSKSYISELMNGISPFSLKDLIVINQLLKIDLDDLIPAFLMPQDKKKIQSAIKELDNPKLNASLADLPIIA